jgi:biopolymer transport protein ExbD
MSVRLDHGDDDLQEMHEINVTPFIDVMLVLLIIFMIAAPLATVDMEVNLPSLTAEPRPRPEKPLTLTVNADLSRTIGHARVTARDTTRTLDRETGGNKEKLISLQVDKTVPYGDFIQVMEELRGAGYLKIGLVGLETDQKH